MSPDPNQPCNGIEMSACEVLFASGDLEQARATVIISLYDYAKTIGDALMSVYDQSLDKLVPPTGVVRR